MNLRNFCISVAAAGLLTGCHALKMSDATVQRTLHGMSPSCTERYLVYLESKKDIALDSIVTIADHIVLKGQVSARKDKDANPGDRQISFSLFRAMGSRSNPNMPEMKSDPGDLSKGVMIWYHMGKKKSRLEVKEFRKLQDIAAP